MDGTSWRTHTKEDIVIQLYARNLTPRFGPPEKRSSGSSYWEAFSSMLCGSGLWDSLKNWVLGYYHVLPSIAIYRANDCTGLVTYPKENTEIKLDVHVFMELLNSKKASPLACLICYRLNLVLFVLSFPIAGYSGPRCYPYGFGENLRKAWEHHLGTGPGRRDLRFKPQPFKPMCIRAQFDNMPMEDLWEDAKLWEPLSYLFNSKRLRPGRHYVHMFCF